MEKLNERIEVMHHLALGMDGIVDKYLIPIETNWQPSDFLPDPTQESFFDEVKEIQKAAKELSYDYWAVLIGDMITEEALPTYESTIIAVNGVDMVHEPQGWSRATRTSGLVARHTRLVPAAGWVWRFGRCSRHTPHLDQDRLRRCEPGF